MVSGVPVAMLTSRDAPDRYSSSSPVPPLFQVSSSAGKVPPPGGVRLTVLMSLMLAATGPVWIGVDAVDPQISPELVQRAQQAAAEALGLRQRRHGDLSAWQGRLGAVDAAFRQGNLEASRSALNRLIQELEAPGHPWLESVDLLADALLMLGQIHLHLQDELAAASAFQRHHALRPNSRPDPSLFRPEVLQAYDRLAVSNLAGVRRTLRIEARPAGATIWIDGKPRGQSPMEVSGLLPGRHYLRVVAGARSVQAVVDLGSEGKSQSFDLGADAQTVAAFFDAWRRQQGAATVVEASRRSGMGNARIAVGLGRAAAGTELIGLRIGPTGSIEQLVRSPMEGEDLRPLADLVRQLRDGGGSTPTEDQIEGVFGRPPSQVRPVVIGAVASGLVVVVGAAVGLSLWLYVDSGIVIDPGGL